MKSFLNIINEPQKIAVYFLKNFSFILFIYNIFYKFKNKKIYYQEIEKRKNLSIFNYKQLSLPIPYYPIESIKDSNFYGINHSIKKYTGIKKIKQSFEHGLYFGNYIPFATFLKTTKSIITFSDNRKKYLIKSRFNLNLILDIFSLNAQIPKILIKLLLPGFTCIKFY